MSATRKNTEQSVYTIRIATELLDEMHDIAESEHRTLAQHIRVLFEREVAARRDRQKDAA